MPHFYNPRLYEKVATESVTAAKMARKRISPSMPLSPSPLKRIVLRAWTEYLSGFTFAKAFSQPGKLSTG